MLPNREMVIWMQHYHAYEVCIDCGRSWYLPEWRDETSRIYQQSSVNVPEQIRSGSAYYSGGDILDERGRELCGEYCRFGDLKRTEYFKNSSIWEYSSGSARFFNPNIRYTHFNLTFATADHQWQWVQQSGILSRCLICTGAARSQSWHLYIKWRNHKFRF